MSDELRILLIAIVAGLLLLTPAAYFGGQMGVIIACIILTAMSCIALMYGQSMGNAYANVNASSPWNNELLLGFLRFAILYIFISYLAFCFSQMIHGIPGYKIKLIVCTLILIGYPSFLYARQTYGDYVRTTKNYKTNIVIVHPIDFPIQLNELRFFNTKTKESSFSTLRFLENNNKLLDIEGLRSENRDLQSHRYYTKIKYSLIPINFDAFTMSWYSVLDQKYYKDVFPLDQNKLRAYQEYDGQMIISDMLVNILPKGHVDVLKQEYREHVHVAQYNDVAFTKVENQSLEAIWKLFTPIGNPKHYKKNLKRDFALLEAGTRTTLSPETILSFRSVYNYGFHVETKQIRHTSFEIADIKIIDFYLNSYIRDAKFLRGAITKPLPSFIAVSLNDPKTDKTYWIEFVFDKKSLFDVYEAFAEVHKETLTFEILIHTEDPNKSNIALKSEDAKVVIKHWRFQESAI